MPFQPKLICLAAVSIALMTSCKKPQPSSEDGSDVQFVPVAVGAAYGIGISTEAAVAALAAGGIYVMDCTRPVVEGEIRFFCDSPAKFGQAAMTLIVNSTRTLVSALRWSHANVTAHLSELSKNASSGTLKSSTVGTSSTQGVAGALVSPEIKSQSGRINFISSLKSAVSIQDKNKNKCDYVAQYEARIVPREYKGGWMGGTTTRFVARAPSPESAESMAIVACEWYTQTLYRPAPGFAGYSKSNNDCRKPRSIANFKEAYRTGDMGCPSVRVCTSESACADFPAK